MQCIFKRQEKKNRLKESPREYLVFTGQVAEYCNEMKAYGK